MRGTLYVRVTPQHCTQEDAAENQRHNLSGNYGKPYEVLFVKDVR